MNYSKNFPGKIITFFKNTGGAGTSSTEDIPVELSQKTTSDEEHLPISFVTDQSEKIILQEVSINACENLPKALDLFASPSIKKYLDDTDNLLVLKLNISEDFNDLDPTQLLGLTKKFRKKSAVILFASTSDQNFLIYWKSNEIEKFMTLKVYESEFMRSNRILFEFIAKFLTKSLRSNHLGLRKFDTKHESTEFELHFLADHRDYNILLIAAEMGDISVVEILLKLDIETESPFRNINAQSLAYNGQHFHILLLLLNRNLTFPVDMDIYKCSTEVQSFVGMCMQFHEYIKAGDIANVAKIIQENQHLHYFYNELNESAPAVALKSNQPQVYEILLINEVHFAPHEKIELVLEELEYETQREVREIHVKNSKDVSESHLNILMANTSVCHEVLNPKDMTSHVQDAFNILNTIPLIRIILMVVAASKKFKIIFDFNRDTVQVIDPTSGAHTNGLFYTSGRIFIGAKQLLNEATRNLTLATMAHEFCHYALNLTFRNDANPYDYNDNQSMQEFEEISKYCEDNQDKEEVIGLVYGCYPEDMYHAELAVRVAHLTALYHGESEKLQESRNNFKDLYDFIELKVAPQMTAAIPDIESKVDREIEKKDKKILKYRRKFHISIVIGIIMAAVIAFFFYKPDYNFGKLSVKQQDIVKNGNVLYKNVKVKLNELFDENSLIYGNITSDHISKLLNGKVLNLNDPHLYYLDELVTLNWKSLAGNLKEKILSSNFNFQGQILKFTDIISMHSEAFEFLTSEQLKDILDEKLISVGHKIESVDFYVERKFRPEGYRMIWFEFLFGNVTKDITSIEYFNTFFEQSFDTWFGIFERVKNNLYFRRRYYDLDSEHFEFMRSNSSQIIEHASEDKILLLSSEPGAGKSVTFEQIGIKIKQNFPTHWISCIELKDHIKFYKTNGTIDNLQELLIKILNLSSENKFERKIFEKAFKFGNVVLLWSGFDEISPTYNEFVLNFIENIHRNTENVQYLSTRPLYADQLSKAFRIPIWQLFPFDENSKHEFLAKFLQFQNVSSDKIEKNIKKVNEIIEKLQFNDDANYNFNTPLMLKFVSEINEELDFEKSINLYKIYDKFVNKKIKIWLEKSTNTEEDAKNLRFFGVLEKIYQKYAMTSFSSLFSYNTLGSKMGKLQIMQTKIPKGLSIQEISTMGILYINGKNNFEFAHATFEQFFIAQYFIDNIYNAEDFVDEDEANLRLEIFHSSLKMYGSAQKIITDFMNSYLEIENKSEVSNFSEKISQLLRSRFKNFILDLLKAIYPGIFNFVFKFFQKDHKLLIDLLHINEDETFYTEIFNPNRFAIYVSPDEIKRLAQNCLNDEELEKFLNGRNQKGKILYGINFYKSIGVTKVHEKYEQSLNFTSFLDFFNESKPILTQVEKNEMYKSVLSPNIYLFYDQMFSYLDYENVWIEIENLIPKKDMKNALANAIIQFFETIPFDRKDGELFTSLLLTKIEKFLSNSDIFDIFYENNILYQSIRHHFELFWKFFKNHSNFEDCRKILQLSGYGDRYVNYPHNLRNVKTSTTHFKYQFYDFTPFNVLQGSALNSFSFLFNMTVEIYGEYFNITELQDMILNSNDFILYVIRKSNKPICVEVIEYLERIFKGNENQIKNLLDRKVKPTKLSVLDYVESYRGIKFSQGDWFDNLKLFNDLYDRVKTF